MARTPEQFHWDEATAFTEALAKADWEVSRAWSAETGLRFRPPWEQAHPYERDQYRYAAERVLLRGGAINCSPLRDRLKRPVDEDSYQAKLMESQT